MHELVGHLEDWGKKELYEEFAARGYIRGCEVGVRRGDNSKHMFSVIPGLYMVLVDPYMPYEYKHQHRRNKWKWSQEKMDSIRHFACRKMRQCDVRWLMTTSEAAAPLVEDESLDFVYIDGDHSFNHAMMDILLWWPKVKKGGVLSGHDYGIRGVGTAVRAFASKNNVKVGVTDRMKEPGRSSTVRSWVIEKK